MKYPVGLISPDGEVASYGELKSYLRAVRYDTAKRWASRKTREELEHIVAAMFARNRVWAGLPNRNEKRSNKIGLAFMLDQKKKLESAPKEAIRKVGQKGGIASKAKYRVMEAEVAEWYAANKHNYPRNKNGAAMAITKLWPIEFETARKWIREPKKKRASTGRG